MHPIFFTKLTTASTCYIILNYLEHPVLPLDYTHLAQKMTHEETGISADGLIILLPSDQADAKAIFYNKDGSLANTCANGLKLIGYHLAEIGRFTEPSITIETRTTLATLSLDHSIISVDLGIPYPLNNLSTPLTLNSPISEFCEEISTSSENWEADTISIGNPHFIIYTDDDHEYFQDEMKYLSSQNDVNIGVLTIIHPSEVLLTTYERGLGFTSSCGTNAAAAIASAVARRLVKPYDWVTVHCREADLQLKWDENGHLIEKGSCTKVCCGTYFYQEQE